MNERVNELAPEVPWTCRSLLSAWTAANKRSACNVLQAWDWRFRTDDSHEELFVPHRVDSVSDDVRDEVLRRLVDAQRTVGTAVWRCRHHHQFIISISSSV